MKQQLTSDKKNNVSIFGSCVSRDMIESGLTSGAEIQLKTYIARQSVISSVSPPLVFDEDTIKLSSAFQKRMVIDDLKKKAFDLFSSDGSDYLIVDFIDERFNLASIDNSFVTCSTELLNSSFLPENTVQLRRQKTADGFTFNNIYIYIY